MDKKQVLEKIKKCLALSKSANENEAAQALKHAQALMRKYGLTDFDVALAEVTESGVRAPMQCARWQVGLFQICCNAFGCSGYLDHEFDTLSYRYKGIFKFYGIAPKPALASYAYDVLLRQLRLARRQYIAAKLKSVRLSKNKTYRADKFCEGWIIAVSNKVETFANSHEEKQKIEFYFKQLKNMRALKPKESKVKNNVKANALNDQNNGYEKGKNAQLNHAMTGGEEQKRLEL